jgi:hypothetical protein
MSFRAIRLSLVVVAVLASSACSAERGTDDGSSSSTAGAIELAVSETCGDETDPQCVSVNGQSVVSPSTFERAGVEEVAVIEPGGPNGVEVTFDAEGTKVFHELTAEAVEAGDTARLVLKAGDEILSAVQVTQVMDGDRVQIGLGPDESARDLVDLIRAG